MPLAQVWIRLAKPREGTFSFTGLDQAGQAAFPLSEVSLVFWRDLSSALLVMSSPLEQWLLQRQSPPEVIHRLCVADGFELISDLAYAFVDVDEADEADCLDEWVEAWALQPQQGGAGRVLKIMQQYEAKQQAKASARPSARPSSASSSGLQAPAPKATATRPRKPFHVWSGAAPKPRPVVTVTRDQEARLAAARQAVDLSWSWAPIAGLKKIATTPSEVVLTRLHESQVRRISRFEAATILRTLTTWTKWVSYLRELGIEDVLEVTNDFQFLAQEFIESATTSASSAKTRFHHVKWLVEHLKAPIPIEGIYVPVQEASLARPPQQAVVGTINLIAFLEEACGLFWHSEPFQSAPLAMALAMAHGCIRYIHLQRSRPLYRTASFVVFQAFRGKTKSDGVRAAFQWVLPRHGVVLPRRGIVSSLSPGGAAVPFSDVLWDLWHRIHARKGDVHCIGFTDLQGSEMSMQHMLLVVRSMASEILQDVADTALITSYTFRRYAPTLLDVRQAAWPERMAVGGWRELAQSGQQQPKLSSMPARYAATRQQQETTAKLVQVLMARTLHDAGAGANWSESQRHWTLTLQQNPHFLEQLQSQASAMLPRSDRDYEPAAGWEQSLQELLRRKEIRTGAPVVPRPTLTSTQVKRPLPVSEILGVSSGSEVVASFIHR